MLPREPLEPLKGLIDQLVKGIAPPSSATVQLSGISQYLDDPAFDDHTAVLQLLESSSKALASLANDGVRPACGDLSAISAIGSGTPSAPAGAPLPGSGTLPDPEVTESRQRQLRLEALRRQQRGLPSCLQHLLFLEAPAASAAGPPSDNDPEARLPSGDGMLVDGDTAAAAPLARLQSDAGMRVDDDGVLCDGGNGMLVDDAAVQAPSATSHPLPAEQAADSALGQRMWQLKELSGPAARFRAHRLMYLLTTRARKYSDEVRELRGAPPGFMCIGGRPSGFWVCTRARVLAA